MEPIVVVQKALAALEDHNIHALRPYFAPDFQVYNMYPMPLQLETFLLLLAQFNRAFPDWRFNATAMTQVGNTVTAMTEQSGTHLGHYASLLPNYPGIPPTGKAFRLSPRQLTFGIHDQKISTLTAAGDSRTFGLELFQQLGIALPA